MIRILTRYSRRASLVFSLFSCQLIFHSLDKGWRRKNPTQICCCFCTRIIFFEDRNSLFYFFNKNLTRTKSLIPFGQSSISLSSSITNGNFTRKLFAMTNRSGHATELGIILKGLKSILKISRAVQRTYTVLVHITRHRVYEW